METKPCRKCGSTDRYKPNPGRKTGACRTCKKVNRKAWRKANPEKERTYSKTWRKANIEKNRAKTNAYRKTNSKKYAAHNAVNNAIKRGDLPRVLTCDCVDCGIQAADYHHEDYSKPLDVEPLCRLCHVKRHNPDN
jgi:hypothetical protein